MISPNVETFIGCDSSYRAADIVLYGAPFDSTTSYRPGARFGPSAIRHESFGLETYSPYQNADLTDFDIFDSGDLELCFGSSAAALADIEARAAEILKDGKLPLLLGGEHLVTLGAVRAVAQKYPGLHIIHFDAHADLRDDYLGAKLSHACVLRRCHEIVGDGRIHQFCIRSGERAEFEFAAQHTEMHKFDFTGLAELTEQLCATKEPVYLTIDLDCLDPSCFPGTGTPEAGGVSFLQLLDAIRTGPYGRCVFACDNDVVDHQIVSMEMENDVTISFSMDAFTLGDQRETHIRLTHGEIDGDERILRVRRFRGGEEQVYDFSGILGKPFHAGADLNLVEDFVDTISRREHRFRTSIGKSVESHRICFEAERSRLSGQTVILDQTR